MSVNSGEGHVVIDRDEEGQYFAHVPELPGCQTSADTIDELMANIREAIDLYLEVAPDRGEQFPSVRKVAVG